MTTFPGVATLKEDNVPVMVGLDDEKITLVSGEVSIGEWLAGQYEVIDLGAGEFVIEAEDDSIPFVPDDPSSFALGIQRDIETPAAAAEQAGRLEHSRSRRGHHRSRPPWPPSGCSPSSPPPSASGRQLSLLVIAGF